MERIDGIEERRRDDTSGRDVGSNGFLTNVHEHCERYSNSQERSLKYIGKLKKFSRTLYKLTKYSKTLPFEYLNIRIFKIRINYLYD